VSIHEELGLGMSVTCTFSKICPWGHLWNIIWRPPYLY
jgi:hypothetical protein